MEIAQVKFVLVCFALVLYHKDVDCLNESSSTPVGSYIMESSLRQNEVVSTPIFSSCSSLFARSTTNITMALSPAVLSQIRSCILSRKVNGNYPYDMNLPPTFPNNTVVRVEVWPMSLSNVDEYQQHVTMRIDVTLHWNDDRLRWPPEVLMKFNRNQMLQQQQEVAYENSVVWRPALLNFEATNKASMPLIGQRIVGYHDGAMRMRGEFYDERTCQIRTRYFPFDRQCCPFTIAALNMATLEPIPLTPKKLDEAWRFVSGDSDGGENVTDGEQVTLAYRTGEWMMYAKREYLQPALYTKRIEHNFNDDAQLLQYKLILTRKPGQHVLYNIVPPIAFSYFTVLTVFCGCDPSERLSFAASILVTMSVMLNDLRDQLAVGVDGYPVLGQLYMGLMFSLMLTIAVCSWPEKFYARMEDDKKLDDEQEKVPREKKKFSWTVVKVEEITKTMLKGEKIEKLASRPETGRDLRQLWRTAIMRSVKLPARQATFRRALMCGILLLQTGVVIGVAIQWIAQPLGDYAHWFGNGASNIDEFCD